MNRDIRIDFLRGMVLLLIVSDHVLFNEASWFAFGEWTFFDGAAAFVFMSGLVCGMVYSRVLRRDGWIAAQWKAMRRVMQLYIAQLVMLAGVCGLLLLCGRSAPVDANPFGLDTMFNNPREAIPKALELLYSPWLMDVLKLYIVLLTILPSMLWLYHRSRVATIAISFALYAVAQKYPEITPYEYPHHLRWFWNPVGWQLLFFGAAALGCERGRGTLRIPRNAWLIALAAVGLVAVIVLRHMDILPWMWTARQKLAPMHVIGFSLFAYLVSGLLKPDWAFWTGPIARQVTRCGRHSLPVFCTGAIIDYVVSLVLQPVHGRLLEALIVAGGVALTLVAAMVIEWWQTPHEHAVASIAASQAAPAIPASIVPVSSMAQHTSSTSRTAVVAGAS